MTLRDYQAAAITDIQNAIRMHRRVLFVLPTGGGKTAIMSVIAQRAAAKGKRILILVHRIELLRQTVQALRRVGVEAGIVNPNFGANYLLPVQVGMVQTVVKRLMYFRHGFDMVLTDEAHHAPAGNYTKVLAHFPRAFSLGVTATPVRGDGKGLGSEYDCIVQGPTIRSLIDMGYLVEPVVYAPAKALDLTGVRSRMGDYDKTQIAGLMDKPTVTGDAVAHYRKLLDGQPAVAFCVSVAHAQHVAEQFRVAGYKAEAVDGAMELSERQRILDGLGSGAVQVVTSCDIISEGTDIPAIAGAILLRPTQSTGLYMQQVGRALRVVEGKTQAVILDHVGNCMRHGMPDDEREWSLEGVVKRGRKAAEDEVRAKQCKSCYAVYHAGKAVCPACGAAPEGKPRVVEHEEGELVRVEAKKKYSKDIIEHAKMARLDYKKCQWIFRNANGTVSYSIEQPRRGERIWEFNDECVFNIPLKYAYTDEEFEMWLYNIDDVLNYDSAKQKRSEVGSARTLQELERIERERGYKRGWAQMVYRARQARV